jgi:hypothetical protein
VARFTDVFTLSIGEVNAVDGPGYAPKIPEDATFSMGPVPQRPWTRPQNIDVNRQIDDMVSAGILRRIDLRDIKCMNRITLADKDQDQGLTWNKLLHELEEECVHNGVLPRDNLPLKDPPGDM